MASYRSVEFNSGPATRHLRLLDQTKLPLDVTYVDCFTVKEVGECIKKLCVRGAPAIGIAAAYGVLLSSGLQGPQLDTAKVEADIDYLATTRPTAVNLFWALERMQRKLAACCARSLDEVYSELHAEASAIDREDVDMCRRIGEFGATLLPEGGGILTHCNTGGLATSELGTALSAIITAHRQGRGIHVFADETRPLLQGSRLTMWELQQYGVPATLICDNMAAQVMREGRVQAAIVGADRIAANGDTANKIGTYGVAVLAKHHQIPFYVAAPSSTFDLTLETGVKIPIENRSSLEITCGFGKQTAPHDIQVYNPAFDVTPADLIAGIITEKGIISPVCAKNVAAMLATDAGE